MKAELQKQLPVLITFRSSFMQEEVLNITPIENYLENWNRDHLWTKVNIILSRKEKNDTFKQPNHCIRDS